MELENDKEYHRKAIALLICFFVAFMYVETVLKPYMQKDQVAPSGESSVRSTTPEQQAGTQGEAPAATPSVSSSPQQLTAEPTANPGVQTPSAVRAERPSDQEVQAGGILQVRTENLEVAVSLLGGRITELRLRDYKASLKSDARGLNLVQHSEKVPYPLGVYVGNQSDVWTEYRLLSGEPKIELEKGAASQAVVLEGVLPDGQRIQKTISFESEGYLVNVTAKLITPAANSTQAVSIEWNRFLPEDDSSFLDPYNTQGFVWFDDQKARRTPIADAAPEEELGAIRWVSIADKYFTATLLSSGELLHGKALKTASIYSIRLKGSSTGVDATLFAGPKSLSLLETLGNRLELNIDFGLLAIISAPLLSLLNFLYRLFGNYGLAIVTLTIGVRLLLYPLNSASFKQMKKMQDLKPEMDRIREQYSDRQEQQMQLMAMYKKHNVNPVGGCLPMVLQMPIFFGLYSALMLAVELRHAPFALWIKDLSAPESLQIAGFGIPVMVILFVISMVVQQWTTPTQMDPTQKKMMMVMPVVLGFMFASFPSGLTLYWLTSNLISIGQQKGLYWAHDGGKSALKITLSVSAAVFVFAFIITLF